MSATFASAMETPKKLDFNRRLELTSSVRLSFLNKKKVMIGNGMPIFEDLREGRHCSLLGVSSIQFGMAKSVEIQWMTIAVVGIGWMKVRGDWGA
jgi:hypothetical protein